MNIKTLSVAEAKNNGFRTVRYGMRNYLPVALPKAVQHQEGFQDMIAAQFDPQFGEGKDEGYFVQAIEDIRGCVGLPGTIYIARAHYSHNDGVQDWTIFGAVEV